MDLYHSYDKLEKIYGKQTKYNDYLNELVMSYINGEDVEQFAPIEELEDTPDFMMNVVYASVKSDNYDYAKVLKLAGDNVKKNYDVVNACLFRYYDRPDVLIEICKDFIRLNKTGIPEKDLLNADTTEILVRTIDTLRFDIGNIEDYLSDLNEFGEEFNRRYDYALSIYRKKPIKSKDFGFQFIANQFKNNQYTLPYIASRTIEKILESDSIDSKLCQYASKCVSDDDASRVLPTVFNEVISKDANLLDYISSNPSLINKAMRRVKEELEKRITYVKYKNSQNDGVNPKAMIFVNKAGK